MHGCELNEKSLFLIETFEMQHLGMELGTLKKKF